LQVARADSVSPDALERGREARSEAAKAAAIPFSPELLLSDADNLALLQLQRSGKSLSAFQQQQLHTTFVFSRRWAIQDETRFDKEFYQNYVGLHSNAADVTKRRRRFFALRRQVIWECRGRRWSGGAVCTYRKYDVGLYAHIFSYVLKAGLCPTACMDKVLMGEKGDVALCAYCLSIL